MFVAKKSLFDLIDNDPEVVEQSVFLNEKQYIAEIMQAINQLLNTRCIFPKAKQQTRLPLNYGLPYLYGMQEPDDLMHPEKQTEWLKVLVRTVRYFESRLKRPKARITGVNIKTQTINVEFSGEIMLREHPRRVVFPVGVAKNLY